MKRPAIWRKQHPFKTLLLATLLFGAIIVGYVRVTQFQWCTPNPFVATNPHSARYNPENFCLGNYKEERLRDAFRATFPVGTQKAAVDQTMAKSKCHPVEDANRKAFTRYVCPRPFNHPLQMVLLSGTKSTSHLFLYGDDNTLINIHPQGAGDKIFETMPGRADLTKKDEVIDGDP